MKVGEIYPRPWLRVKDLPEGRAFAIRIRAIEARPGWGGERRLVVAFEPPLGGKFELFLSRTNAWALAEALGEEIERWVGAEILVSRARRGGRETIRITKAQKEEEWTQ